MYDIHFDLSDLFCFPKTKAVYNPNWTTDEKLSSATFSHANYNTHEVKKVLQFVYITIESIRKGTASI